MKAQYYFYNRETDRYIYNSNFKNILNLYNNTKSHNKYVGLSILDEDGCTMLDDVLLEHKEK